METKQELDSTTKIVRSLLETDQLARNSVKGCMWLVWKELCSYQGVEFKIPFGLFAALPSSETISRVRRHIQNTIGDFQPEPEIEMKQREREQNFKEYYGSY